MISYIENRIRAGKNLREIRLLLAAAATLVPQLRFTDKARKLIFAGRLLVEFCAGRFEAAEQLLAREVVKRDVSDGAVNTYIETVVYAGKAKRLHEILGSPNLSPGNAALLQLAVRRLNNLPHEARVGLSASIGGSSMQFSSKARRDLRREWTAEDGIAKVQAEPDRLRLPLLLSSAFSAEACGREDLFGAAIRHLLNQLTKVESDPVLLHTNLKSAVEAKLSLFDLQGARLLLSKVPDLHTPDLTFLLRQLDEIVSQTSHYPWVVRKAHEDILRRARGEQFVENGVPIVVMPAAAFRTNKIDYPGFRSDIRFVVGEIIGELELRKIEYQVVSRFATHSVVNYLSPCFSYHSISSNKKGLHFKETDRPSLFSFDRRGYSGWSEFSELVLVEDLLSDVPLEEARSFFAIEQKEVIGRNLSKYIQSDTLNSVPFPSRFIFVALQLEADAVGQLAYQSLRSMLEQVVETAKAQSLSVVVKRHPLCKSPEMMRYITQLESEGAIFLTAASIHSVIPRAEAVCVVNSSVGAEALLHEVPVYVFGRAEYMAACFVCKSPSDFADQFMPGNRRLSPDDLRRFWYLLRKQYAVDLKDRNAAAVQIRSRVTDHLRSLEVPPCKPETP